MSLVSSLLALWLGAAPAAPLVACADPNNRPYSHAMGDGFENRIAAVIARELGRPLEYFWSPQRRGFVRTTLAAGRCDVVLGVPSGSERVLTTRPYYRSSYVFVARRDRHLRVRSFDDPRLRTLTIGIQLTGGGYDNPPAAQALAVRGLFDNVRGFPVYGDYSRRDPQRDLIDAVAERRIDVAVAWGPLAGYFAAREPVRLDLTVVQPGAAATAPFAFDIAMGVRPGDTALRAALDRALTRRAADVRRILTEFGVPLT
jgi:quinoprotein dehydrogenase-associated probable ABC transporter substrate-binding protein